jgi:hypothetical protein
MSAWAKPLKVEPELPKVKIEWVAYSANRNMNNLPDKITINGTVWTRTASASASGTYSYGSNGGTSSDIATNAHYTVSPISLVSSDIYNVHYTVYGPTGAVRYYYYPGEQKDRRFQPAGSIPDDVLKKLKFMVDKLFFTWSWFYAGGSAYGPATPEQVS